MSAVQPAAIVVRPAVPDDVNAIHDLLAVYAEEHLLLPRSHADLRLHIGNFQVVFVDGVFAGCAALRDYGNELYEVRSLAIAKEFQDQGIASKLVQAQIDSLRERGVPARMFALTYRDAFFCRLGFKIVKKDLFPQKIWSDCAQCSKKEQCDEIAVLLPVNRPE